MGFRTIQLKDLTHSRLSVLKKKFGEKGKHISFDTVISKLHKFWKDNHGSR